jgi:hypothetical protein
VYGDEQQTHHAQYSFHFPVFFKSMYSSGYASEASQGLRTSIPDFLLKEYAN